MESLVIRNLQPSDCDACLKIYNYYIENTEYSFEEKTLSEAEFSARITAIASKYPFLVAEENGKIVGYAYLHEFQSRSAYRFSTEVSIYMDKDLLNRGVGTALLSALETQAKAMGIKTVISIITSSNKNSIAFHQKNGYIFMGELHDVGYKFEKWYSITYLQKEL